MSWQIDYTHSQIQFTVRHLLSNVRGQFDKFTGTIELDEQNLANTKVDVQIEAASVNTKLEARDDHLRSPDFLDAANHPYLIFKSKRIEPIDNSHARLSGDLTIRGVSREVTLEVEYHGQVKSPFDAVISAGFTAQTTIDRRDWGLTWNALIETGGVAVGNEVRIIIDLELLKPIETVEPALEAAAA